MNASRQALAQPVAQPVEQQLAQNQSALVAAIHAATFSHAVQGLAACGVASAASHQQHRGLHAYRANAQALAPRTLRAAYPVLAQVLGDENFTSLARDFWFDAPPARGDLAQWGADLAAWIGQNPALAELVDQLAFVIDLARAEWAIHTCAAAADATLDSASFALLTQEDPANIKLCMAPGTHILQSRFPVDSILAARGVGDIDSWHCPAAQANSFLIWRQGFAVQCLQIAATDAAFTQAVVNRLSLKDALEVASADFDLSTWLVGQVGQGWICGVSAHQSNQAIELHPLAQAPQRLASSSQCWDSGSSRCADSPTCKGNGAWCAWCAWCEAAR